MNHFLDLAERLQVKGLTSDVTSTSTSNNGGSNKKAVSNPLLASTSTPTPTPSLLKKANNQSPMPSPAKKIKQAKDEEPQLNSSIAKDESDAPNDDIIKDEEDNNSNTLEEETGVGNDSGDFLHSTFGTAFKDEETDDLNSSFENNSSTTTMQHQANTIEPIIAADGTKEYPCVYCDKRYITRARLKRHVLDCHETGNFSCPACGKIFSSSRRLKDHQRSRYCHGQGQGQVHVGVSEPSVILSEQQEQMS